MSPRLPNGGRLTPGRVRSMTFRLARLGHRGLDEDDVLDFCGQVEAELSQLTQERDTLQREVHRLRGWARAQNQAGSRARNRAGTAPALPLGAPVTAEAGAGWAAGPDGAVAARAAGPVEARAAGIAGVPALTSPASGHSLTPPHGLGLAPPRCRHQDAHGQAVRILAKAQQTADQYVSDAHAYSRTVAHDAQRRRERILAEAHAQATVLLEQAHQAAVRAGFTLDQGPASQRGGRPLDQGPARPLDQGPAWPLEQGPAGPLGQGPARPPAAVPALPAPVPEPRPPAPARAPDRTPAAEPAIYNAVVARYPHVAPARRELQAGPASIYDFPPRYDPDPTRAPSETSDPRAANAPGVPGPGAPGGRPGPGAHRATSPGRSPAPRYPTPPYNLPVPPPDYSTVIDYPGPAADYQALHPVHHERPRDRDRPGRDRRDRSGRNNAWFNRNSSEQDEETDREARRYLDQYRDPGSGQPPFPF